MSDWLNNAWYMAAWSEEVGETWLARRLLDQPVLIYRKQDGEAVALLDRCPHRFAPLSRGRQVGDLVQCGYHGLQFDASGACVHNQIAGGTIPPGTRTRAYPIVEQHEMLWIWMGDPERADPATVPDYSLLSDPDFGWRAFGASNWLEMNSNYRLITDNLLDATHASFLHGETFARLSNSFDLGKLETGKVGNKLVVKLMVEDSPSPVPGGGRIQQWFDMYWQPPGAFWLDIGRLPVGVEPRKNKRGYIIHIVTPATATSTHYFFGTAQPSDYRPYPGAKVDEVNALARHAFTTEDEPMIHACQENMAGLDFWANKPAILPSDRGAVLARRMLDAMIREERHARAEQEAAPDMIAASVSSQ